MIDMNKMKLSEPLMIKIQNKMNKNFCYYEDEISKALNPKISNLVINLIRDLGKKLDDEYQKIKKKINSLKENENFDSGKVKKASLNTKLSMYFREGPMPVQKRITKVRKTHVNSEYFKTKIRTFLRSDISFAAPVDEDICVIETDGRLIAATDKNIFNELKLFNTDEDLFLIDTLKRNTSSFIYASLTRKSVYKVYLEKLDFKKKELLFKLPSNLQPQNFKIHKSKSGKNFALQLNSRQFLRYTLLTKEKSPIFDLDIQYCEIYSNSWSERKLEKFEDCDKSFQNNKNFSSGKKSRKKKIFDNWVIRTIETTDILTFILIESQGNGYKNYEENGCLQGSEFIAGLDSEGKKTLEKTPSRYQRVLVLDQDLEILEEIQIDHNTSIGRNLYFGNERMHEGTIAFNNTTDDSLLKTYVKTESFSQGNSHYLTLATKVYAEEVDDDVIEEFEEEGSDDLILDDDDFLSQEPVFKTSNSSSKKQKGSSGVDFRRRNVIKKTVKFVEKIHLAFYQFSSQGDLKMIKTSNLELENKNEFENFDSMNFIFSKRYAKKINFYFIAFFKNKVKLYCFDENFKHEKLDEVNLANSFYGMEFGWQRKESSKNKPVRLRGKDEGYECVLWNHSQIAKLSLFRDHLPFKKSFNNLMF